ncbi:MAG TPA: FHA domain-containing protein [Anaerolineaceae bacterium]
MNRTVIITIVGLLVFLAVWVLTVLMVWGASGARRLPRVERLFWAALAVALPIVGAGIYLLARAFAFIVAVPRSDASLYREATDPQIGTPSIFGPTPQLFSAAGQPPVPHPQPSFGRLVITQGPAAGRAVELSMLPARIGRGEGVLLDLDPDRKVSRQHAEIFERGGRLFLRDLDSLHGTKLNGKPLREQRLAPGDTIQVGDTLIAVELVR